MRVKGRKFYLRDSALAKNEKKNNVRKKIFSGSPPFREKCSLRLESMCTSTYGRCKAVRFKKRFDQLPEKMGGGEDQKQRSVAASKSYDGSYVLVSGQALFSLTCPACISRRLHLASSYVGVERGDAGHKKGWRKEGGVRSPSLKASYVLYSYSRETRAQWAVVGLLGRRKS